MASVGPSLSFMVNGLLTLNFKKFKRSKNNRTCILCSKCKVHFRILFFWGAKMFSYLFDKKIRKRRKRRERRGGKKRKTKQGEREKEKNRFIPIFTNQTYPSRLVCRFSTFHWLSLVITYTTLNFKSGQFCSLSFNAHTCFWQNAKRLSRLKTGIFHTQQSGGL